MVISAVLIALISVSAHAQTYDETDFTKYAVVKGGAIQAGQLTNDDIAAFLAAPPRDRIARLYKGRIAQFDSMPASEQERPDNMNGHAVALIWTGKPDLAAELLHELTKRQPKNPMYHRNWAMALERLGLYTRAQEEAQRALTFDKEPLSDREKFRLERLEYLAKAERDPNWAATHLTYQNYTDAFINRKMPPASFTQFRHPQGRNTDGMLRHLFESLTYAPHYADGWLMCGMLVEMRGGQKTAFDAYRYYGRALDEDHPMSGQIQLHRNAMQKILPRGSTPMDSLWQLGQNIWLGALGAGCVAGFYYGGGWYLRRRSGMPSKPRKKRYGPQDWAKQDEERLLAKLEKQLGALHEDAPGGERKPLVAKKKTTKEEMEDLVRREHVGRAFSVDDDPKSKKKKIGR